MPGQQVDGPVPHRDHIMSRGMTFSHVFSNIC
jgi:hypothetical protein